jgi:hypothetical protein
VTGKASSLLKKPAALPHLRCHHSHLEQVDQEGGPHGGSSEEVLRMLAAGGWPTIGPGYAPYLWTPYPPTDRRLSVAPVEDAWTAAVMVP